MTHSAVSSISSSSTVPNASLMRTTRLRPSADVATPTTIAVRMSTCGRGFEYTTSCSPCTKIGAVPPAIGLSLVVRINEAFGTVEEDEIEDTAL